MPHEEALQKVSLFSQLPRKDLARMGRAVVERKYKKGEAIVKQGESAVAFFMITKGRVEVSQSLTNKKTNVLGEMIPGPSGVFGEMSLLNGLPRVATIRAMEDTECLVLSRWDFLAELQTNPQIAVAMLPILSTRLREVEIKLDEALSH